MTIEFHPLKEAIKVKVKVVPPDLPIHKNTIS